MHIKKYANQGIPEEEYKRIAKSNRIKNHLEAIMEWDPKAGA